MNQLTHLIRDLDNGESRLLVIYGTSLSFHLAPLLRDALVARYDGRVTVVNSGLSGKASRSGLAELEQKVIQHQPDALLLEFAVNDAYLYEEYPDETLDKGITLEESRGNLESIIAQVKAALPECEILLQTMNPTFDAASNAQRAGSRRPELAAFYQGYRDVAHALGLKLIDNAALWSEIQRDEPTRFQELVPDGAHPKPATIRSILVPHLLAELGVVPRDSNVF